MKGVAVYSDYKDDKEYERMIRVLERSWKRYNNMPLQVIYIPPDPRYSEDTIANGFQRNHIKLKHWINAVDQDCVLMDCDMLCQGEMASGFDLVDHIGITKRPDFKFPYNGGVVYVKNTKEAKKFLKKWYEIDGFMLENSDFHELYKTRYAGINQASMGCMIENGYKDLITFLPCSVYNLCQPWSGDWEQAHMIHVKSELRKYIFGNLNLKKKKNRLRYPMDTIKSIAKEWYEYEQSD